ncbi:MAG: gamma-glutamylcyclotransferase (GGCT)/AIG2-like uncharacterized protein YtfP [Bermanella sp.]|jgi:gamma-glutamylcyclotransferase (GGCT)/AIG2-like uncharacterized protein YtfP
MPQLFSYGTLMHRPLLECLTAPGLDTVEVQLCGYACLNVKRADYPAIFESAESVVSGLLVRGVPSAAWQQLDRYEGEMYRRTEVLVQKATREDEEVWTYVIRPRYRARLGNREWKFSRKAEKYANAQLEVILSADK